MKTGDLQDLQKTAEDGHMKTLYLHIGLHKTATTTIQHFLTENDEVLKTKGYTYPKFPVHYPYLGKDRNGIFLGTPYLDYDGERRMDIEAENYKTCMGIIHELFETYPNVILSNERLWFDLSKAEGALMQRLLDDASEYGYRIKMIVYVRRQDKFIESFWNEQIKSNILETRKFEQYKDEYDRLLFGEYFSRLGDMAGDENLIMRRFDEVVRGEGILPDFMKAIGLELTDEDTISVEKANTQLYGNITEIKRRMNEMEGLKRGDADFLRESLWMASDTSKKNYPCAELSVEERTEFMKKFEDENRMLADRFIGDGKPLFSEDYSGLPKREDDNPEFISDVIRSSAAADVLLLRRLKEAEKAIKAFGKRIDKLEEKGKKLEEKNKKLEEKNKKLEERVDKQSVRIDHLRHPVKALMNRGKN